uniref:Putative polymerase III alpha subunit protein n=1 Tax=viral metagenome TaxID=1070528 RepID=A0A6M3J1A8_9ZZZZ
MHGKRREKIMDKQGYGTKEEIKKTAEHIWEQMMGFSNYAFPKGHSTSYALMAYATQFLKVNFPIEFFCAHLQQATDDEYNLIKNVARIQYKVKFILPDINKSKNKFIIIKTKKGDKIAWSISSIKGVGIKAANEIISKQPFSSFEDFYNKVNKRVVNVRVINTLITANTFRKFNNRNTIMKSHMKLRKAEPPDKLSNKTWDLMATKLMPYYGKSIRELFPEESALAMSYEEFIIKKKGKRIIIVGIIDSYREMTSKRGKMIIMSINDSGETFIVICWNDFYNKMKKNNLQLGVGMPVRISGYKSFSNRKEEQITLGRESGAYIKILGKEE